MDSGPDKTQPTREERWEVTLSSLQNVPSPPPPPNASGRLLARRGGRRPRWSATRRPLSTAPPNFSPRGRCSWERAKGAMHLNEKLRPTGVCFGTNCARGGRGPSGAFGSVIVRGPLPAPCRHRSCRRHPFLATPSCRHQSLPLLVVAPFPLTPSQVATMGIPEMLVVANVGGALLATADTDSGGHGLARGPGDSREDFQIYGATHT